MIWCAHRVSTVVGSIPFPHLPSDPMPNTDIDQPVNGRPKHVSFLSCSDAACAVNSDSVTTTVYPQPQPLVNRVRTHDDNHATAALRVVPRDEHMARMEEIVAAVDAAMGVREAPVTITAVPDSPADAELIARGVHCTPWFYHGRRWLFVVDHTHSVLHMEPVTDHEHEMDAQVQSLRVMLMALDPQALRIED